MHRLLLTALVLASPVAAQAESALPFGKDMAGDRELPLPWGIGIDFFTMDQEYDIAQLELSLPGVVIPNPELINVDNDIKHYDIRLDVWLLPFLNVFGIVGHVNSDTIVDLSETPIQGLPIPISQLDFDSDGTVLGLGFTLAYGGDGWFTSVTTTYTDTDLGGDFDSSAETVTVQPRLGFIKGSWVGWVGGMYLDTEESHSGTIGIPGIGSFDFDVLLETKDKWNNTVGIRHNFSRKASLAFELGFGSRDHTHFNYTYRF